VIYDEAVQFIKANRDQPFFCYLPFTPPHGIFDIPDSDPAWALYKDKPWPAQAKRYAAMVSMVDRQVGELVELLKELDLDEHTIFFFCGDNGGADYFKDPRHPRGFHGANVHPETGVEFRGRKGNLYEGGLRIPMIVRWPGHIQPGRVSDFLWYFPDVLPTLAELAGAKAPPDIDGLSIVPELLGEDAAGRKQESHEYLYWELGQQTAVRKGHWKAIRPGTKKDGELYDLSRDVSERNNVAADHPDRLAGMKAFAEAAHEDAREGVFYNRAIHERDRQAKFGFSGKAAAPSGKVHTLPDKGLVPHKKMKVLRVSSESRPNGKLAANAIDGNPLSHWHTQFQEKLHHHPHEIVIDLGDTYTVRGFRYLARQDSGWNGTIKKCELFVGASPDAFGSPAVSATLKKTKEPQEITCEPVRGRYVRLRALSEINDGPWASVAEFGVIGKP
jgi:hypothetical protein